MADPTQPPPTLFLPVIIHQGVAYVSGQLPRVEGQLQFTGKVGAEVSIADARDAARICVENCLNQLTAALGEGVEIARILKITGFIASAPGFNNQGAVLDAASELLLARLGDAGTRARSAIGVAELPFNAPVEIEMVAAVSNIG